MLLISIHPFAFRRLALIVLAVAGFSALCFADPVLMAHRYTSESPRTHVARSAAASHSNLTFASVPGSTGHMTSIAAADRNDIFEKVTLAPFTVFLGSAIRTGDWPIEGFDGIAGEQALLMASD